MSCKLHSQLDRNVGSEQALTFLHSPVPAHCSPHARHSSACTSVPKCEQCEGNMGPRLRQQCGA